MLRLLFICSIFLITSGRQIKISRQKPSYDNTREKWLKQERRMALGAKEKLGCNEKIVNDMLMAAKKAELQEGFKHPEKFPAALHFFQARPLIEKSTIFQFIKEMPKGGALHIHPQAVGSSEWIIEHAIKRSDLYLCLKETDKETNYKFKYSRVQPSDSCYKPTKHYFDNDPDFTDKLKIYLSLDKGTNEKQPYGDINEVWKVFEGCFDRRDTLLNYVPVYKEYLYEVCDIFRRDNVQYLEIRGAKSKLYELDRNITDPIEATGIMMDILNKYKEDHADFMIDIKIIFTAARFGDNKRMEQRIELYLKIKEKFKDAIVGYDLVGQEDKGRLITDLVHIFKKKMPPDTNYFFHAGETNWNMLPVDLNLMDAVLLHTKRIGHGYALTKHPLLMKKIKEMDIAVEICPISNQVLMLVEDLRNHPASTLFAEDFKLVIAPDDPGLWGARGLSYDFYLAFMGIASADADLKTLKTLAFNSIKYSALPKDAATEALRKFNKTYHSFIDKVTKRKSLIS